MQELINKATQIAEDSGYKAPVDVALELVDLLMSREDKLELEEAFGNVFYIEDEIESIQ